MCAREYPSRPNHAKTVKIVSVANNYNIRPDASVHNRRVCVRITMHRHITLHHVRPFGVRASVNKVAYTGPEPAGTGRTLIKWTADFIRECINLRRNEISGRFGFQTFKHVGIYRPKRCDTIYKWNC